MSLFKKQTAPQPVDAAIEGERRQLTVLFYDIVGSTALAERHDPEALRAVLNGIHAAARRAITDHGGSLEQVLGDGGMAYFGYPVLTENAAYQAVAAALALIEARDAIAGAPDIRIGIATSIVVLSDGADLANGDLGAVGVAPNLAARLEAAAPVNAVLVSAGTHALTRRAVDYSPLDGLSLKGFPDETRGWRATGLRRVASRFARDRDGGGVLIGREAETAALSDALAAARLGHGAALVIEGEPGIGKSRILAELVARADDTRTILLQCQPRTESDALFSLIRMYDQAYEDGNDPRLSRAAERTAERLGALEDDPALSPEARRTAILEATVGELADLSRDRPLLIRAEDLHWADEVTLAALAGLASRATALPLLLVATTRPGAMLGDLRAAAHPLDLAPLTDEAARALIDARTTAPLTAATRDWIVDKSDGNPLFLTELTAHAADVSASGGTLDARSGADLRSLRDLLAVRLESAGRAKRTAQIGAVLGREYPYQLLARMATHYGRDELDADLQKLNDHGLQDAHDNGAVYAFRHALVRDVAYDSQLREVRRRLHGQVVDLVDDDPGLAEDVPDILLAEHCLAADRRARGIGLLLDVAEDAIRRSALTAPRAVLERALSLSDGLPATDARDQLQLRAIALLGPLVTFLDGPRHAGPLYDRGQKLYFAQAAADRRSYFPIPWGWWFTASDLVEQARRAEVLIRDVPADADRESRLQALHCGWATLFDQGAHSRCLDAISEGLSLFDPEEGHRARHLYGHDAQVCGLGERALSCWLTGALDESADAIAACEAWADETGHLASQLHALDIATQLAVFREDLPEIERILSRIEDLSGGTASPTLTAKRTIFRSWMEARTGGAVSDTALADALANLRAAGTLEDTPFYADIVAEIMAVGGKTRAALAGLDAEIAEARASGLTYWLPEQLRRKAILEGAGPVAVDALGEGFDLAVAQGAAMLALRNIETWVDLGLPLPAPIRDAGPAQLAQVSACGLRRRVADALAG